MKPTDGMEISATDLARFTLVEMRGGVIVADLDSKLSFQDGALQIAGLDAGRYELTDHFSGQHVPIVVTKGTEQDRMLVGEQRTLAANSFAGLRIHDTKIAGGKLSFQLAGCDPFTRVHVIGTTFDHSAPQTAFLGSYREYQPNVLRARIPSFYMDSLKLDEEYQYVLARQIAVKFRGSLLPHPSVLLNPWELSATTNESIQAAAGDDLARMEAPASAPGMAAPSPATNAPASVVGNSHEYEFLRRGCLVLPNQRCDEQGNISIDLEQFEGLTNVTIVAVHPTISTYQRIALPNEKPLALRDRRLARSLDAKSHYVQREIVRILDAADKHDLGDASLTRVRLYTSIVSLFPLYQSLLNNDAQFEAFQVLRTWPSLSRDQKNLRYGELACHELNLFLFMHDREYFDAVVRPHLINKSPKQFMDDWLLERDLAKYAQPWQLQRLNAVERVLLTKRLESTRAGTKRWLQEYVVLNPIDPTNRARSFGASLRAGGMEGGKDFDAAAAFFAESDAPISGGYGFGRQLSLNGALGAMGGGRGASLGTENANWSLSLADEGQLMAMDKLAEQEFVTEALEEKVKQDRKSGKEAGLARRFSMRDSRSKKQEALFENLQATRRWAESQYYRVPLQNQNANLIMPNAYWREFLDSNDQSKFFSMHADLASKNVHEALMALAVLGLPLESTPPEMSFENDRVIVSKCPNAIAYVQGIVAAEPSDDPSPILVGQNIYLSATSQEPGAKPASLKSLVMGIPYRNRVVLTNPTSQPIRVQLLTQIPQGAIALEAAKTVGAIELDLPPYSTRETSNVFYFPSAGTFEQYGAQVCIADKYVAGSNSTQIQVLEKPDQIDETTWDFISAWGTNQAVLDYLSKANLIKTNLSQIGWRMADREMWEKTVALLSQNAMFNAEIWAYSLKHNSVKRVREFLDNYVPVLANLGPAIRCDLVELSPIDRYTFEHLDFRPIVAARIHMLGTKRVILNDGLAIQFQALMNILAHQKSIDSGNRLSIAYYMLIQNRIEEAVNHFEKADAAQYEGTMQYDYFAAYMDMLRGNYGKASERAEKYVEYPIPRWRDWFVQIRSHVRERERLERGDSIADVGGDQWLTDPTQRALVDGRENRLANAASTAPSLDIVREGDRVFMEYRNIGELKLNYYLMDVELLFSRNPFVQQSGDRQGLIEANQTDSIKVDSTGEVTRREWKIPDNLANKNVVVEVVAGGLVRSIPVYANSITVTLSTTLGRLNVVGKKNHAPIDGAYVKVYAKHNDGRVQFFKDGYTDLRGHFDYATLSTGDLQTTTRFAILVIHPELGAMIRESDPPNRGR